MSKKKKPEKIWQNMVANDRVGEFQLLGPIFVLPEFVDPEYLTTVIINSEDPDDPFHKLYSALVECAEYMGGRVGGGMELVPMEEENRKYPLSHPYLDEKAILFVELIEDADKAKVNPDG